MLTSEFARRAHKFSPRKAGQVRAAADAIVRLAAGAGSTSALPSTRVDRIDRAIHQVKNIACKAMNAAGSLLRVVLNLTVRLSHDLHPL
jgi:hypothetical protein